MAVPDHYRVGVTHITVHTQCRSVNITISTLEYFLRINEQLFLFNAILRVVIATNNLQALGCPGLGNIMFQMWMSSFSKEPTASLRGDPELQPQS